MSLKPFNICEDILCVYDECMYVYAQLYYTICFIIWGGKKACKHIKMAVAVAPIAAKKKKKSHYHCEQSDLYASNTNCCHMIANAGGCRRCRSCLVIVVVVIVVVVVVCLSSVSAENASITFAFHWSYCVFNGKYRQNLQNMRPVVYHICTMYNYDYEYIYRYFDYV